MTKRQAGSKGGRTTFQRHGRAWMREIGRRGNAAMRRLYQLVTVSQSGYALVCKSDGRIVAIW